MDTATRVDIALANYPKAKRMAVENFCFSAPKDKTANRINLAADAKSYPWNRDTVEAIKSVLRAEGKY